MLGGGTGTPKLLWELEAVIDPDRVTVIANTGDDVEFGDLFVSPDVDACLFVGADRIDTERWWGLQDDSTETASALTRYTSAFGLDTEPSFRPPSAQTAGRQIANWRRFEPVPEFMTFGDEDRAIHRARAAALDRGETLTEITRALGQSLGAAFEVLPMSDDPVSTLVSTPSGEMHFQEYWVANRGEVPIEGIEFRGCETANPSDAVLDSITDTSVVIGPSNPVTSIGPICSLSGIETALESRPVVAVSPFLGTDAYSGPAVPLQRAIDQPVGTPGLEHAYPFLDAAVLDDDDDTELDVPTVRTDIRIDSPSDAHRVWRAIWDAFDTIR